MENFIKQEALNHGQKITDEEDDDKEADTDRKIEQELIRMGLGNSDGEQEASTRPHKRYREGCQCPTCTYHVLTKGGMANSLLGGIPTLAAQNQKSKSPKEEKKEQ